MSEPRQPRFVQRPVADARSARDEVVAGLQRVAAVAAPKHFYDRLGSQLFAAITELPEYYPTRTEAAIFERHGEALARVVGPGVVLIDLGAGDCAKAARLMPLLRPARYVAVDISVEYLREALLALQRLHPALEVLGIGTDFSTTLDLPDEATTGRPVFFYPGSSIGNFTPPRPSPSCAACVRVPRAAGSSSASISSSRRTCSRPPTTTRSASRRPST